jgi:hypothetical protein
MCVIKLILFNKRSLILIYLPLSIFIIPFLKLVAIVLNCVVVDAQSRVIQVALGSEVPWHGPTLQDQWRLLRHGQELMDLLIHRAW